jgi:RNA 3'-terminal phosphate cyclase (ATP)
MSIERVAPVAVYGGFSAVAALPTSIAQRQAVRAQCGLAKLGLKGTLREQSWGGSPGTVLAVELPTTPAPTLMFALGERGKSAERVADEVVAHVERFLGAEPPGIDEHSADQLLLPLALAAEESSFPVSAVSNHLLTNVSVIQEFVPRKIEVAGKLGRAGHIRIE